MPDDKGIVCRPRPWRLATAAMFVAAGVTWLMGWGLSVACLVGIATDLVVVILTPTGRPGRWTE